MKKVYEIDCFTTNGWGNEEAENLLFKLQEKMYDYYEDKKEALDYFFGRFDFLKNNWLKEWIDEVKQEHPNITIGVELYECEVEDDFNCDEDSALDYGHPIETLYFLEGSC